MSKTKGGKRSDQDYIVAYSRADAIRDGVLRDVSEMAREVGFRVSVAITHAAYARYVRVPKGVTGQCEQGRLWDILWMCRAEVQRCMDRRDELLFELLVRNDDERPRPVVLKSVASAGDDGELVITVMLPEED